MGSSSENRHAMADQEENERATVGTDDSTVDHVTDLSKSPIQYSPLVCVAKTNREPRRTYVGIARSEPPGLSFWTGGTSDKGSTSGMDDDERVKRKARDDELAVSRRKSHRN
jgi:hypothetical protein